MDKKILKIIKNGKPAEQEKAVLLENGFMTEKIGHSHGELISLIRSAAEELSLEKAAKGFLYSISSKDLRYRTAISSLIWARAVPEHDFLYDSNRYSYHKDKRHCDICGALTDIADNTVETDPLSAYHTQLFPNRCFMDICNAEYVYCDLLSFKNLPDVEYTDDDIKILNRVFGLVGELAPGNKATALLKLVSREKDIDLTQDNVYSILGVLSHCGVFDTPGHKSLLSGFVNNAERGFEYECDCYYPLNYWRGKHGINYGAIADIFGKEVSEKLSPETAIVGKVNEKPQKAKKSKADRYFTDNVHFVELNDRYRCYYGLSPLDPKWDKKVMFSATYDYYKRTEIYFDGDTIKKVIYEQIVTKFNRREYLETDTDTKTVDREMIVPKTARGSLQPLNPSKLITPTYMHGHLEVLINNDTSAVSVSVFNSQNDQYLPTYHIENTGFEDYTEKYIASCPPDYGKLLDSFRNKKRVTVKFTAGDIFRVQITPTLYTYGLILGKVRQLEKWDELPKDHGIRKVMTQPIIFRQYDIVTSNPAMTAEELEKYPLLEPNLAQDNFVLWETYPITAAKKLKENDIDLYFAVNVKEKTVYWDINLYKLEEDFDKIFADADENDLKRCDGRGVSLYITVKEKYREGATDSEETPADRLKKCVAEYYGLDENSPADDMAARFGGITRREYIALAEKR
ncbi:MAG: immunity 26/phosphotriesterase HocA family protein, partial [Firmicutes bacterium]|nr:immunity 26/phosphotriesterase HocA family protein [Bacillota bacterium]